MLKKIELLSPAGSMESLIAAIEAGCDAVYLGLSSYSARAFAQNFSLTNIADTIAYCHIRDVRVYVTMNTLIYEAEFKGLQKAVDILYHADVDGILVQDLGLYHYIQQTYPDLPLHCSTQMHIHNVAAVRYMKSQKATRCVIARECSLATIRKMCKEDIEIEVFVYGAICIAYSGQCLMSSSLKGRSANRGVCAQNCRLKYQEDGKYAKDGEYCLSPKDLNAIELVPELISAGVASLKIEGRMKSPSYVYAVTKAFRQAIDAYYQKKEFKLSVTEEKKLFTLFNRGFSKGHLANENIMQRMAHLRPNHQGIKLAYVLATHGRYIQMKLIHDLSQGDGIRILSHPLDIGFVVNKMENQKGLLCKLAKAGEIVQVYCPNGWAKIGDEVRLTNDVNLVKDIQNEISKHKRRVLINIKLNAKIDEPLFLEVMDGRQKLLLRTNMLCQKALKKPLGKERLKEALGQLEDSAYKLQKIDFVLDDFFLPMKEINQLRRQMIKKLDQSRAILNTNRKTKQAYKFTLQDPLYHGDLLLVEGPKTNIKAHYLSAQEISATVNENNEKYQNYKNVVLNEMGTFYGQHENCIAGMSLNITNSYSLAYFLAQKGVDAAILSSELKPIQIKNLIQNFIKRYGFIPFTYQFVFGKRNLMIIKQGFDDIRANTLTDLQDHHYQLSYTDKEVFIHEPMVYRRKNEYAKGSYLIIDKTVINAEKILEEAYEEIFNRI